MASTTRASAPFWLLLLGIGLLLAGPGTVSWGEEDEQAPEAAEAGEAEKSPLREAETDEAKKLLDALKKVARKKNANDVLPKLEPMQEVHHTAFEKTFLKLLKHPSSLVAVKMAEMWDWRITPKNVKKVWKASWGEKKNDRRYRVKTLVLRAMARAGHILDKRQYDEIERDWRSMIGAPSESFGEAMADICWYFEKTKDKRHCRWLALELDYQFENVDPSNPATPPTSVQEQRWKMWKYSKAAAVSALMAITGQEFDKTEEAKRWFEANEKTFGFKW